MFSYSSPLGKMKYQLTALWPEAYLIEPGALQNSNAAPEHLKQSVLPQKGLKHCAGCPTEYSH